MDFLIALGAHTGTTVDGKPWKWFEWTTPVHLAGVGLTLAILGNEDPTDDEPDRWAWRTEVHDSPTLQGRILTSTLSRSRAEAVSLASGVLNVVAHQANSANGSSSRAA